MMEEPQITVPVPEAIMERRTHVHYPTGTVILEHVLEHGIWPEGLDRFQTRVTLTVDLTNGQELQKQRHVGVSAERLDEAFAMLPEITKAVGEQLLAEVREELGPKIQTAGPQDRSISLAC